MKKCKCVYDDEGLCDHCSFPKKRQSMDGNGRWVDVGRTNNTGNSGKVGKPSNPGQLKQDKELLAKVRDDFSHKFVLHKPDGWEEVSVNYLLDVQERVIRAEERERAVIIACYCPCSACLKEEEHCLGKECQVEE